MLENGEEKSIQPRKSSRKPRTVERKWDDDDTYKLIRMVGDMKHLWDSKDEHYKDFRKRESSFRDIGLALNRSSTDCKAKWDNLRVQYRCYFLKDKTKDSSLENYIIKWKYYEELNFLSSICKPTNKFQLTKSIANDDDFDNSWSSMLSLRSTSVEQQEVKKEVEPSIEELEHEMVFPTSPMTNTKADSSQIFGDFVADRLRHLTHHKAELTKNKIMQVLLEASTGSLGP